MAAAIMVCLQLYIPRFQSLQNLFIKIINKKHITVKIFDKRLLIFKTGSSSTNGYWLSGCCLAASV